MFHENSAPPAAPASAPHTGYPQDYTQARLDRLEQHVSALGAIIDQLRERTPATMRIELDGLTTALEQLSISNRREFARIYRRLGHDEAAARGEVAHQEHGVPQDEFSAFLALQQAQPK